jgi:UDP-3-O-[3-hydroxymyristoyl] glucosamine N-acyltransferase
MSLNRLFADQPLPEIAGSARLLGNVHVGAGAILAQGVVVRSHDGSVSVGNHSAVLENSVVIGTREHPVRIGQRTVFGHRAQIVGATVGDLARSATAPSSCRGQGSATAASWVRGRSSREAR